MEEYKILENLRKNLYDLENIENEISMVELAIYQKSVEELSNKKINEIRELFENQAKFYNQKSEKYNYEIDKNIEEYKSQIEKLVNVYDDLYLMVFKIMSSAMNNQKIAIANIVTLKEKLKKANLDSDEIEKIKNTMIACAEKKLNYSVIIDECMERIKWCTQNVQNDINEIFVNNIYQLQVYDENIINKVKRSFFNILFGKSSYKKFIDNYEAENLKDIKLKNNEKILDIAATIKGVKKQMEETRKQISLKYEERVKV